MEIGLFELQRALHRVAEENGGSSREDTTRP